MHVAESHLVLVVAGVKAGGTLRDHEGGNALGALGLVGYGKGHDDIGTVPVGDEGLAAVDDVSVAVLTGGGGHVHRIGTGAALREGEGNDAAGSHGFRGHMALLFRAGQAEGGEAESRHPGGKAYVAACQLFPNDGAGQIVQPQAAVLFRQGHHGNAHIDGLFDQIFRTLAQFFRLAAGLFDFLLCKVAEQVPQFDLLFCQHEIEICHCHMLCLPLINTRIFNRCFPDIYMIYYTICPIFCIVSNELSAVRPDTNSRPPADGP